MSNNLFIRAYYMYEELENSSPDVAKLIKQLDDNRMDLIRMIEILTEDPGIYDFPEISHSWLEAASELVFDSRNYKE